MVKGLIYCDCKLNQAILSLISSAWWNSLVGGDDEIKIKAVYLMVMAQGGGEEPSKLAMYLGLQTQDE